MCRAVTRHQSILKRKRELGNLGSRRRLESVSTTTNRNWAAESHGPIGVRTASRVRCPSSNRCRAANRGDNEIPVLDVTGGNAYTPPTCTNCRVLSRNNVIWVTFVVAQLALGRGKGDRDLDIEIPKAGDGSSRARHRGAAGGADRLSSLFVVRAGSEECQWCGADDQRDHESTDDCSC